MTSFMSRKRKDETQVAPPLFSSVRELIVSARRTVARGVDIVQVLTNFEIGRLIVEHEQQGKKRAEYGKAQLRELADSLTAEFGRGFSRSNLEYMRKFFLTYRDRAAEKSQLATGKLGKGSKGLSNAEGIPAPLAGSAAGFRLGWTQYVFLMGIKNEEERSFYEMEAADNGWTMSELKRQYNSGLYERLALSRDKQGIRKLAREGQVVAQPEDLLKEPYVLEFLGLETKTRYSESDLETAIIDKLETFLLELGKGFLFEARQKRFTFGEDHFFIDLVFFNRLLRCHVLIDLKIGKVTHQDLGQMQMYVNYYDRHIKTPNEERTIGIILCKKKHDALVEMTLPPDANIHAKEYQLYLPSKDELRRKLLEWTDAEHEGTA